MRLLLFIFISLYATVCHATPSKFHLDIHFNADLKTLEGKATITFPAGEPWQLLTPGLKIKQIQVQEGEQQPFNLPVPIGDSIAMYGTKQKQQVTMVYSFTPPPGDYNNLIGSAGIALTSGWHPIPDRDMIYSLACSLPEGFTAISEPLDNAFSQPVRTIHLAAGPYVIQTEEFRDDLLLSTWFFKEDQDLSKGYLAAAKEYLIHYEREIGKFPYERYGIVANRLPSGFGMPGFTLLGQMVLRLPFIKETSLGHEILHSWFGNSIKVADDSGNWCEGLTSYLADYTYAEKKNKGAEQRKNGLLNYSSYVHGDTGIALQDFRSASHNQPLAKAVRAVGYNRCAMLFHQLRGLIGPEDFFQGIRLFVSTHSGTPAGWADIQKAFETASDKDLSDFFDEQLQRNDVPSLAVSNLQSESRQDGSLLHFTLIQNSEQPYSLKVPLQVTTTDGTHNFSRMISGKETAITLALDQLPLSLNVDPEYDLFRQLAPAEIPPIWSRFLGSQHKLVITDKQSGETLAPFLKMVEKKGWTVMDSGDVTNQQLAEHSLLFVGGKNSAYHSLFGNSTVPPEGFQLQVRNNPLNKNEVVVLVNSGGTVQTGAALRKLSHYGKYSFLSFLRGKIQKKSVVPSEKGLQYLLEELPVGGSTVSMDSFDKIVTELSKNRAIYLGESHDSLADHLLQLRIIQTLHKQGRKVTLAMEMFPVSSHEALDDYVLYKKIDEAEFLRDSHWFDVWRYDFRLFRPIFNYCRQNNIPVHGINVSREIVESVFASGHTDDLSIEQQAVIAQERDLSMDGYVKRLRTVHGFHPESPHGKGNDISGFIQSQAIWDESMAENIVSILQEHPDEIVIVIAGSQHTRKDSGIPPRVSRRMDIPQASVINIYGTHPPANPFLEADFFFMANKIHLEPKGKIGIMLNPEKKDDGKEQLLISGFNHAGKAEKAGLKEKDIILTINGKPAKNMEDIGILMMDSRSGDLLKMTVSRIGEDGEGKEIKITVELSDLSKPPGHP